MSFAAKITFTFKVVRQVALKLKLFTHLSTLARSVRRQVNFSHLKRNRLAHLNNISLVFV